VALIDVGGKGEAVIAIDELKNADGEIEVALDDRIQAMVVSTSGGLKLSRRLVRSAASDRQLEDAFNTGLPVEGKVEGVVKAATRCASAANAHSVRFSDRRARRRRDGARRACLPNSYHEYKDSGSNIVISRRALLEDDSA